MSKILTFGKFIIEKGQSDDPRDVDVSVIGFDFSDDLTDPVERVHAILDYLKEALS
jgi:hypothetical protein